MHGLHQVRTRDPSDPIIPKGSAALKEGLVRAWAYALALVVCAFPFFNPDVFWHLSAGRWIWAHASVPRAEAFSFTRAGTPWIDFEWLTQAVWYAAVRAAGLWGLWLLKGALVAAAFWSVDGLLRDKRASPLARAAAAAFWALCALGVADARPDLATLVFFALLLRRLEAGKASFLFGFALFALWANLHAGFVFGFALYAIYAAAARVERRPARPILGEALGAGLGVLLNPYGLGLFEIFRAHAGANTARFIMEWRPPSPRNTFQAHLFFALCGVFVALVGLVARRRRLPKALTAATVLFGLAAAVSARFGAFFGTAAAALVFVLFPQPPVFFTALALALATPLIPVWQARWVYPFHSNYVARRAAEFVVREKAALGDLRLFNTYEYGGYLGWRMGPDYRVFGDGRYLFADQLPETQDAIAAPENLARFAERERLDGFLIADYRRRYPTQRLYPDGTRKSFQRPWYWFLFPGERWALVYWDDQAILVVDRAKVPAAWLAAHEYRWLRPGDDAAFADALARGEIPRDALAAETARHAAETAGGL